MYFHLHLNLNYLYHKNSFLQKLLNFQFYFFLNFQYNFQYIYYKKLPYEKFHFHHILNFNIIHHKKYYFLK